METYLFSVVVVVLTLCVMLVNFFQYLMALLASIGGEVILPFYRLLLGTLFFLSAVLSLLIMVLFPSSTFAKHFPSWSIPRIISHIGLLLEVLGGVMAIIVLLESSNPLLQARMLLASSSFTFAFVVTWGVFSWIFLALNRNQ